MKFLCGVLLMWSVLLSDMVCNSVSVDVMKDWDELVTVEFTDYHMYFHTESDDITVLTLWASGFEPVEYINVNFREDSEVTYLFKGYDNNLTVEGTAIGIKVTPENCSLDIVSMAFECVKGY